MDNFEDITKTYAKMIEKGVETNVSFNQILNEGGWVLDGKDISTMKEDISEDNPPAISQQITTEDNVIKIGEKTYGLSQGMLNAFQKGADIAVKKVCSNCGFHMPQFSGRYPKDCPLCGTEFDAQKESAKYGAYVKGKCIGILHELKEGIFSTIDQEINEIVSSVVSMAKNNQIRNKADLMNTLKNMKAGKNLPKGIDTKTVNNYFNDIIKKVASALRQNNIQI